MVNQAANRPHRRSNSEVFRAGGLFVDKRGVCCYRENRVVDDTVEKYRLQTELDIIRNYTHLIFF